MPRGRELLERFRLVGAPGSAAHRGVPVDRVAALDAELGPVLALLDDTQSRCADLRERAEQDAAARRATAQRQAAGVLARARVEAEAVRAEAAAQAMAAADAEEAQALRAGALQADRVRAVAAERQPPLLALARVRMADALAEVLRSEP